LPALGRGHVLGSQNLLFEIVNVVRVDRDGSLELVKSSGKFT
jgi:hypothetical protein